MAPLCARMPPQNGNVHFSIRMWMHAAVAYNAGDMRGQVDSTRSAEQCACILTYL